MASSSSSSYLALFLAVSAAINTVAAVEIEVGDAVGWRIPANNETELYNVWASRRRFHVGDSLRFHYKNDSVAVVEKWGFYHCDSSNPISFFNDGDTLVNLDNVGTMYFISGTSDRCRKGQKMMVQVRSQHPPAAAGAPDSPYYAMPPSPAQPSGSGSGSGPRVSSDSVAAAVPMSVSVLVGVGLCLLHS